MLVPLEVKKINRMRLVEKRRAFRLPKVAQN
jgi:hypothetical protein